MTFSEEELDNERAEALAMMSGAPDAAAGGVYTWEGRPDGLAEGIDPDRCLTILRSTFGSQPRIPGYAMVEQWPAGERECPWCGPGTGNEESRANCPLCEGDGLIYWGDDWAVEVWECNPFKYLGPKFPEETRAIACALSQSHRENTADSYETVEQTAYALRAIRKFVGGELDPVSLFLGRNFIEDPDSSDLETILDGDTLRELAHEYLDTLNREETGNDQSGS